MNQTPVAGFLAFAAAPPSIIVNSFDPVPGSEILATNRVWKVSFDSNFNRPGRRTFVQFRFKNGTVVYSVVVSSTLDVQYPGFNDRQLVINTPNITLLERYEYYITMESGVARGLQFCGAESEALLSSVWSFRITTKPTESHNASRPLLAVQSSCYDSIGQSASLSIDAKLRTVIGVTEHLLVNISNIPSGFTLSDSTQLGPGLFSITVGELPNITFSAISTQPLFTSTTLSVAASAVVNSSGHVETVVVQVIVEPCANPTVPTAAPAKATPGPEVKDDKVWIMIVAVVCAIVVCALIILVVFAWTRCHKQSANMSLYEMGAINKGY